MNKVRHALRADGVPLDKLSFPAHCQTPNDKLRSGIHTRGYLPHVKREGASYFVTFRLADSLPQKVLQQFLFEKEQFRISALAKLPGPDDSLESLRMQGDINTQAQKAFQERIEEYLDQGYGACYLGQPKIADLMANTLRHFHNTRYHLDAWVVMPNHVHALLWPMPGYVLSRILQSWKQFVSLRAKRILGLGREPFWQRESYDHWIRNDEEKARIHRYIIHNPPDAGLSKYADQWPWSSAYAGGAR